jgi:hypothetical protein
MNNAWEGGADDSKFSHEEKITVEYILLKIKKFQHIQSAQCIINAIYFFKHWSFQQILFNFYS